MCLKENHHHHHENGDDRHQPSPSPPALPPAPQQQSQWGRIFKQIARPKLINSKKINLNKYWSKFEELMTSPTKVKSFNSKASSSPAGAKKRLAFDGTDKKLITKQNIDDEGIVKHQFVFTEEIDENIANEIKELWSYKSNQCKVCTSY